MSTPSRTISAPRGRSSARTAERRRVAARRQAAVRRRRVLAVLAAAFLAVVATVALRPLFQDAVTQLALPLRHEDIIRQQSRAKGLDPALVAAVIYAESRFIDGRTSSAGAKGLMQLTPDTAHYIARKSGGTQFVESDLGTPQVNIAYGAYYLRYLLDHYGDDHPELAIAAYNAGEGNVDRWVAEAKARDEALNIDAIPFGETRSYVKKVLQARRDYRAEYRRELGL